MNPAVRELSERLDGKLYVDVHAIDTLPGGESDVRLTEEGREEVRAAKGLSSWQVFQAVLLLLPKTHRHLNEERLLMHFRENERVLLEGGETLSRCIDRARNARHQRQQARPREGWSLRTLFGRLLMS